MLWLLLLMTLMWVIVCGLTYKIVGEFYAKSYLNSMRCTTEYTRRVLSDICVGVNNNIDEIENNLNHPDKLQGITRHIIEQNPRIRSCGISFIESYYPQKGKWFCPYTWRQESEKGEEIHSANTGDAEHDYLNSEWFEYAIKADSNFWSKPFFDGYQSNVPLVAYQAPIHDKQGRVVAIIGADISLEWLTKKLAEEDKKNNDDQVVSIFDDRNGYLGNGSYTYIIDHDGMYITHPDEKRILKDNCFNYLTVKNREDSLTLVHIRSELAKGTFHGAHELNGENEGRNARLFFMPIPQTDWVIVTDVLTWAITAPGIALLIVLWFCTFPVLIVIYFVCKFTIKRSTRPLRKLVQSTNEVAKGNFNAALPTLKRNDEIRQLRDSFENMQSSLTRYVEELKTTTAQNASIESELKIAHNIQISMLPKVFPAFPDRTDIDVYGELTPAKAVGGDLFDFFLRDEKLFFCIGDVSGKGIPASMVMAMNISLFRNIAAHSDEPSVIVSSLNEAMVQNNEANMFVTVFVGVLDLTDGTLRYCNAGHNAPLIIEKNSIPQQGNCIHILNTTPNLPVGVMSGFQYEAQKTMVNKGELLFLYTDGLTEAENAKHLLFGEERMNSVAVETLTLIDTTPKAIIDHMTAAIKEFVDKAEQSDDLTMMAIKRN